MKIKSFCKYLSVMFFLCSIVITQSSYGHDGKWEQEDKQGNTIVFEWYRFDGDTLISYLKKKKELAEIIAKSMKSHIEYGITELDKKNLIDTHEDKKVRDKRMGMLRHIKDGTIVEHMKQEIINKCDQDILKYSLPDQEPISVIIFIVVAKETNGKILGFADFREKEVGKVYLNSLGVMPDFRGHGIGAILTLSILKLRPFTQEITLDTATDDKVFYEKLGFELYEENLDGVGLGFKYSVRSIK